MDSIKWPIFVLLVAMGQVAQPEAGQRGVQASLTSIAERLIANQTP